MTEKNYPLVPLQICLKRLSAYLDLAASVERKCRTLIHSSSPERISHSIRYDDILDFASSSSAERYKLGDKKNLINHSDTLPIVWAGEWK